MKKSRFDTSKCYQKNPKNIKPTTTIRMGTNGNSSIVVAAANEQTKHEVETNCFVTNAYSLFDCARLLGYKHLYSA
eukprot:m.134727 g.134727  ORF g.134727 m.134727 type:complete len:76 (-) comp29755_c1_seq1:154-381(-)